MIAMDPISRRLRVSPEREAIRNSLMDAAVVIGALEGEEHITVDAVAHKASQPVEVVESFPRR